MRTTFKPAVIAVSIMAVFASSSASATNGYAAHGFGTVQKAMGGTAVAGHDNAMNIATNPAAMSFGENNWTAGLDLFRPDRQSTIQGLGTLDGNGDEVFAIPEFGYQRRLLNDKYTVGVAVYGNGGMNATYSQPIFGTSNTGIDFAQLFIAPSVSMKINANHAIGASLNLAYQRIEITGVDGFAAFSSDPTRLSDQGYDNSTGAGFTLGWQGQLSPTVKAGFAYRSETKMSEFDDYAGLLAEQGDFDIPSMITAGVSLQARPDTTVALDVARINYTDVTSISNNNPTGPLGADNGSGFGWDDQNIIKLGVKHKLNSKVTLLGGYNHGKAPIPSTETIFNVLAPATVEDHLTLGVDWKLPSNAHVTVQYMHAFENEIKGTPGAPGATHPGTGTPADLSMSQDSIGVAYTRNF